MHRMTDPAPEHTVCCSCEVRKHRRETIPSLDMEQAMEAGKEKASAGESRASCGQDHVVPARPQLRAELSLVEDKQVLKE